MEGNRKRCGKWGSGRFEEGARSQGIQHLRGKATTRKGWGKGAVGARGKWGVPDCVGGCVAW